MKLRKQETEMSQNQETIQPNLRNRWQRLSIRTKLLVPIVFGMAVALLIILIGLQRPIDSVSERAIQEAFFRHTTGVQGDAIVVLKQLQDALSDIALAEPVAGVASGLQVATDQAQRAQIVDALGSLLQNRLSTTKLPFESLRYLDGNGQQIAFAVVTSEAPAGSAIETTLKPQDALVSEGREPYFTNILLMPPTRGLVLPLPSDANNASTSLIQIAVPVYRQGIPVGVLVGSIRAKEFAQSIFPKSEAGKFRTLLLQGDRIAAR
jgi:hypothetical protein